MYGARVGQVYGGPTPILPSVVEFVGKDALVGEAEGSEQEKESNGEELHNATVRKATTEMITASLKLIAGKPGKFIDRSFCSVRTGINARKPCLGCHPCGCRQRLPSPGLLAQERQGADGENRCGHWFGRWGAL